MRRMLAFLMVVTVIGVIAGAAGASGTPELASRATPRELIRSTPAPPPGGAQAVTATDGLALEMLRGVDHAANLVVSPFSIETALSMVDQGASGRTAAQLDTALGGASSPQLLAISNRRLAAGLHSAITDHGAYGPTLSSADDVWIRSGLPLDRAFSTTLAHDFAAPPHEVDFADPTAAVASINRWVSRRTGGEISSLMSSTQVTAATQLVLANAVYLNARWRTPFDASLTRPAEFRTAGGEVSTPFMSSGQDASFAYTSGAGYQAVALPYAHSSLQFLAVMPPAGQIDRLERWLSVSRLSSLATALVSRPLELSLPKFSLSFAAPLNGFLEGLGITQAFGPGSELDRILPGPSLEIQSVEHAAVLQVAEKGTVAAAATGVSAAPTAILARQRVLALNHPFLVFVRDTATGAILFAARILDPANT